MARLLPCCVFSLSRDVSDLTGFPEMLGGRVKTLHPAVHAGMFLLRYFQPKREIRGQWGWEEGVDRYLFCKGCVEELNNENRSALAAAEQVKSTGRRSCAVAELLCCYAGIPAVSRAFPPQGYKKQGSSLSAFTYSLQNQFQTSLGRELRWISPVDESGVQHKEHDSIGFSGWFLHV